MRDTKHDLHAATRVAQTLLAAYRAELGDDEQAVADFLEGETDLLVVVDAVLGRLFELEDHIAALVEHGKKLNDRNSRFKAQHAGLRQALLSALEVADVKTLERPIGTLTRKLLPPAARVDDPALLPADYLIEQPKKVDQRKLTAALRDGAVVPGAELSNASTTIAITRS